RPGAVALALDTDVGHDEGRVAIAAGVAGGALVAARLDVVVASSPHEVDEEPGAREALPDERPLREPLVAIEVERGEADLAGVIVAPQPARATAQGRVVQAEGRLVAAVD